MLITSDRLASLLQENCSLETPTACLIKLLNYVREFERRISGSEPLVDMAQSFDHEISLHLLLILDSIP
ncbi:MAG: hypothetical protein ACFKPT_02625 [Gloeotrichia echinulata GP01]